MSLVQVEEIGGRWVPIIDGHPKELYPSKDDALRSCMGGLVSTHPLKLHFLAERLDDLAYRIEYYAGFQGATPLSIALRGAEAELRKAAGE